MNSYSTMENKCITFSPYDPDSRQSVICTSFGRHAKKKNRSLLDNRNLKIIYTFMFWVGLIECSHIGEIILLLVLFKRVVLNIEKNLIQKQQRAYITGKRSAFCIQGRSDVITGILLCKRGVIKNKTKYRGGGTALIIFIPTTIAKRR